MVLADRRPDCLWDVVLRGAGMTRCECGCGQLAIKRFVHGHNPHPPLIGEKNGSWKGGRLVQDNRGGGQVFLRMPNHPRANQRGYAMEHIVLAERALGHRLRSDAQVHHVNGNGQDNQRGNLVICHDQKYHRLLHRRTEALKITGNPNMRKCHHCKEWDLDSNMQRSGRRFYHRRCHATYEYNRKQRARAALP